LITFLTDIRLKAVINLALFTLITPVTTLALI
jgi:hypothetical protein